MKKPTRPKKKKPQTVTAFEYAQFMYGHTSRKGCLLICTGMPVIYMVSPCEIETIETLVQIYNPETHLVIAQPTNPGRFRETMQGELTVGMYHQEEPEAQQEFKNIDPDCESPLNPDSIENFSTRGALKQALLSSLR